MPDLTGLILSIVISTGLGLLTGLGIGGGSLLILWLTIVIGMEQNTARSINLLFFLPSSLMSCLFRWRQGNLPLKKILPAAISGTACAIITSFIATSIDPALLQKPFGILLLAAGAKELFYRTRNAK